jgi:hypothetical protein
MQVCRCAGQCEGKDVTPFCRPDKPTRARGIENVRDRTFIRTVFILRADFMPAIDIRRLFRVAWERAKASQGVRDDDPVLENVQTSVVRSIAELEVARLQRTNHVPLNRVPLNHVPPENAGSAAAREHEDDRPLSKVA